MSQDPETSAPSTTFDELLRPLEETLHSIEAGRHPHYREVLSFVAFVRLLLYHFVKGTGSGRQLLTDVCSAAASLKLPPVKKSTFFDTFERFPVAWFALLLNTVLAGVSWQVIPELAALGKLYCIDGSLFPALTHMVWAAYQTNRPALKLHLCFELNRMLAVQFIVDAGNSNEREALRQMLEAGVTYIADRGYVCFTLLEDIVKANAHFVMRMRANLVYTPVAALVVTLPEAVGQLFTQVTDQRVRLSGAAGEPLYRLVTFWAGGEAYLILTDRLELTTFQVILLYAYRWQVELIFRFLKRTLNGLHLLSTSPAGVTIQFYVLLLAALLELHLKQPCVAAVEEMERAPVPSTPVAVVLVQPAVVTLLQTPSPGAATVVSTLPGPTGEPAQARIKGQGFLATIGSKLQRYWKISVHWLVTLRNLLAQPFDHRAIRLLGGT